jgi:hypothetical protein
MMSAFKAMGRGATGTVLRSDHRFFTAVPTKPCACQHDSIGAAAAAALDSGRWRWLQTDARPTWAGRGRDMTHRHSDAGVARLSSSGAVAAGPHAWSGGDMTNKYTQRTTHRRQSHARLLLQHRKA